MGTPEFAVPILEKVHSELGICAVVTVPDKLQGRGLKLQQSAVSIKATELGLPILKPEKLKDEDFISELRKFEPDIILVVAFRILPEEVFSLAKIGTFNIHASLLPRLRGAAPINWAIINGEKKTGLTTFLIDKKVDTGNLLLQEEFELPEHFTAGDLHDYMMPIAAELGVRTCELLITGNYEPKQQADSLATPAPKIFPEQAEIVWNNNSSEVRRFIHGFSPFPGARTKFEGRMMKILRVSDSDAIGIDSGEFKIGTGEFLVGCKDGTLSVQELQLEGKKAMKIMDFLNGYRGVKSGKIG